MSNTAPKTPEQTPRKTAMNRSFTLPSKIATPSRTAPTAEIGAAEGIETLYTHPNAKVIKFTSSGTTSRPGSNAGTPSPGGLQVQGGLPWATTTEQTLAAGPLEVYRVPGSVSFLHSGSLLHAILPRSNCWCVDGKSIFAMRVLPETYYRIELPGNLPEDLEKVEEFKQCLKKVLFYERTPCPFARTFTVQLPEEPEIKVRRKVKSHGRAKKWKLDRAYSWKPEDGPESPRRDSASSGSATGSDEDSSSSTEDARLEAPELIENITLNTPSKRPTVRERAMGINMRSVTAPSQMPLQATPPSTRLRSSLVPGPQERSRSRSPHRATPGALDTSTLRPFQAIPTDMPPSPPDSSAGLDYIEHTSRTVPEAEVSAEQPGSNPVHHAPLSVNDVNDSGDYAAKENENASLILESQWDAKPAARVKSEADGTTRLPISNAAHHLETRHETDGTRDAFVTEDEATRGEHTAEHETVEIDTNVPLIDAEVQIEPAEPEDLHPSIEHDATTLQQELTLDKQNSLDNHNGKTNAGPTRRQARQQDLGNDASLPQTRRLGGPATVIDQPLRDSEVAYTTSANPAPQPREDPYAQIQARIQARRSIGGTTTSFAPPTKSPTRRSSSTTVSSASLSSKRSDLSRRSTSSHTKQQALATALVQKACAVFLGPPARLVEIMLRIAARFARGFGFLENDGGVARRVPGSFDLDGSDFEDLGMMGEEEEEDDFGVPVRSPIRLRGMEEELARTLERDLVGRGDEGNASGSVRERRGWDGSIGADEKS